jgi:uncharacterized Zn-finger protein
MNSDFIDSLLSSDPEYSDLNSISEDSSWQTYYSSPKPVEDPTTVSTQTSTEAVGKVCPECNQLFVSLKGMRQHMAKTHVELERKASCPMCDKMFRHKYAVNFHIKQVHIKSTRVSCPYCHKEIYNKYMLNKHCRNHHITYI